MPLALALTWPKLTLDCQTKQVFEVFAIVACIGTFSHKKLPMTLVLRM